MSDGGYRYTLGEDALGVVVELHGPGLPYCDNGVHVQQHATAWAQKVLEETGKYWERDAERIVMLLRCAFEAGRRARTEELQKLLEGG